MSAIAIAVSPLRGRAKRPQDRPRKKRRGDPRYALPPVETELCGDEKRFRFPVAEVAGASAEQLTQASIEMELGMPGHARRQAHCGVLGKALLCIDDPSHKFRKNYGCGNRYCFSCARRNYNRLFARHARLFPFVADLLLLHPYWLVAKVDFTVRNTGRIATAEEVKRFNQDVRRFFKEIEKRGYVDKGGFGAIGCNEFGGQGKTSLPGRGTFNGNTNLHAHYAYVGPPLPQSKKRKELSAIWSEIRGEKAFVSIKRANSFAGGLAHALKYAGKFLSRDPRRLAQLEKAFFRVRRVHAFRLFYNPKIAGPAKEKAGGPDHCPHCDALLCEPTVGWLPVPRLEKEGWRDLAVARIEANRLKAFREPAPP